MTMNQWTQAAKAIAGIAFGDPETRAKQDQLDLEKQKVDIQNKQYMLEEALNPAKISQAEAAAAYNNAQAKTEATALLLKQMELEGWNNLKGRRDGFGNPPVPSVPAMPEFNPYNVGPQGQGNNPAMVMPYDQIQPLDLGPGGAGDIPVPKGPPPPTMPMNLESLGADVFGTPPPENEFNDLIANLTAPPAAPTPAAPTSMLTPDVVDLLMSKSLSGQNIGDFILAQEAFNANQGVTDPNKRIMNAAAGRGTFVSPDQVTAQAMGSTLPTARLSELGVQNMGTANMKDYEKTLTDPKYGTFLAEQNAGTQTTVSYDANGKPIVTMGKGGNKPLTEVQGKNRTTANALREPLAIVEKMNAEGYEPNWTDYTLFTQSLDSPMGASLAIPNMSPEGQRYYGAFAPIAASIANQLSGQGMSDQEQRRRLLATIAIPNEDKIARQLKFTTMRSYFQSADEIGNPNRQEPQTNTSATATEDPTGLVDQSAPVQIQDDAGYEALPSGTTFIAPDGTTRIKP